MSPLDHPTQPLRNEAWNEILDIVDRLHHLDVGGKTKPLTIDNEISPNLPTSGECIRKLTLGMRYPMSPSLAGTLQRGVDQLRDQVLRNYTGSVSRMVSLKDIMGQDDFDVQRKYTNSLESWFDQATKELFAALTAPHKVRISLHSL